MAKKGSWNKRLHQSNWKQSLFLGMYIKNVNKACQQDICRYTCSPRCDFDLLCFSFVPQMMCLFPHINHLLLVLAHSGVLLGGNTSESETQFQHSRVFRLCKAAWKPSKYSSPYRTCSVSVFLNLETFCIVKHINVCLVSAVLYRFIL